MWSIGSGSKSGGGNGDRNLLLQEAKRERERREREREQRAYGFRLKNFLQLVSFRRREARRFRTDLTKKLNDLDAVANMLAKKGMKSFLPPAATLAEILHNALISDALVIVEISLDRNYSAAAAITNLARLLHWISKSFVQAQQGPTQISSSHPGILNAFKRAIMVALRVIATQDVHVETSSRLLLLDFISSLTTRRNGPCVFDQSNTMSISLASFLVRDLLFFETTVRPLCFLASPGGLTISSSSSSSSSPSPSSSSSSSEGSILVASRAIELSLDLIDQIFSPVARSGLFQAFWTSLLTVPWFSTRLFGSKGYYRLVESLSNLLYASEGIRLSELVTPIEYLPRPLPSTRRKRGKETQNSISPAAASAFISSPSPSSPQSAVRSVLVSASASAAEVAFSASESAFSSPGLYASPEKSFFDSPLARGTTTGINGLTTDSKIQNSASSSSSSYSSSSSSPSSPTIYHFNVFSGVDRHSVESWPASAYLLGNLIALLSTPLSQNPNLSLIAELDTGAAEIATRSVSVLLESLPESVQLSSSRPFLWVNEQPIPMPPQLLAQFRKLSSERFARSAASALVQMNVQGLKNSRLRLQDDDDPDRHTYDESSGLEVDRIRAAKAIGDKSTSLDASPSTAGAVLRGLWETSKLATAFLQRQLSRTINVEPTTKSSSGSSMSAMTTAATALPFKSQTTNPSGSGSSAFVSDEAVWAFIRLYANLLAPRQSTSANGAGTGMDSDAIVTRIPILNALSFTPDLNLAKKLWFFFVERTDLTTFVKTKSYRVCASHDGLFGGLALLATIIGHQLLIVDDYELYQRGSLLPLREIRHVARLFRDVLAHSYGIGVDDWTSGGSRELLVSPPSPFFYRFQAAAASALRSLYERHSQRALGPADVFVIDVNKVSLCLLSLKHPDQPPLSGNEAIEEAINRLMSLMPWSVPFFVRVERFEKVRIEHRRMSQEGQPQVRVSVQRARLFDSVLAALKDVRGDLLRRKVNVQFINDEGLPEAGIDAGGLFKELWTQLTAIIFDPRFGLFSLTNSEGGKELYPNPSSSLLTGFDDTITFELLGRVLGKALYEGVTVETRFARFFLHYLSGRAVHLHHLPSLDQELYKSLMFLKSYQGNVEEDLCLSFTSSIEIGAGGEGGGGTDIDLVPGGSSIPVTNSNRLSYIHLLAEYRLGGAIATQNQAFLAGLRDVLPANWLTPFSAPELQVLISGAHSGIDISDLKANTIYANGFSSYDSCISRFWQIVSSFSDQDKAALLKFSTSCSRPPPLGFKQLEPKFCIQRVPFTGRESEAPLPSSSTCFNVLKLPDYKSETVMKEKLLMALRSGAGFEMT
jgi:ubiquitin-protein ligase E3 C